MEMETVPSTQVRPRRTSKKPKAPAAPAPETTGGVTYVCRKPIKIGARRFKIGDPIPEASTWTRVESWVRSGYIDVVEA